MPPKQPLWFTCPTGRGGSIRGCYPTFSAGGGAPAFESRDAALRVREGQPLPLRSGVLEMGDPHGTQL